MLTNLTHPPTPNDPLASFSLNAGTHHVVIHKDPCDEIGQQVALGLLAGIATGAALRSFLWMPFWFC